MVTLEPVKDVTDLIASTWGGVSSLSSDPEFSTGKWSREHKMPAVVVHAQEETPLDGGNTGYTGMSGDTGSGMQVRQGTVLVEAVAGRRGDVSENPKKVRSQMANHIMDLLIDDTSWPEGYRSIAPRNTRDMEATTDEEGTDVIYLREIRVRYLYTLTP